MDLETIEATAPALSPKKAAAYLGCTVDILARWRWAGTGPCFVKLGPNPQSPVRYSLADLQKYVAALNNG